MDGDTYLINHYLFFLKNNAYRLRGNFITYFNFMSLIQFVNRFSISVYDFLSEVFNFNNTFSELGVTDHFIHALMKYSSTFGSADIKIYKAPWTVESKYGNDLDLFIQNTSGTYSWYALQAKVMAPNGAFKDIKIKRDKILQQWDKLLCHEKKFGSKSYYLLYSGKSKRPPITTPIRVDCEGVPTIRELGLGIVETHQIKRIRETVLRSYALLFFNDVFPNHIDSIRKLFCDLLISAPTFKQFKREDILISGYQLLYRNNDLDDVISDVNEKGLSDGDAPVRIIITVGEDLNQLPKK